MTRRGRKGPNSNERRKDNHAQAKLKLLRHYLTPWVNEFLFSLLAYSKQLEVALFTQAILKFSNGVRCRELSSIRFIFNTIPEGTEVHAGNI